MDKKTLSPPRFFARRKLSTFRGAGTPNWNWMTQGSMRWKLTNLQLTICFEALLPPQIGMEFLWLWASLLRLYSAACPQHSQGFAIVAIKIGDPICQALFVVLFQHIVLNAPNMSDNENRKTWGEVCAYVLSVLYLDWYKCIQNTTWMWFIAIIIPSNWSNHPRRNILKHLLLIHLSKFWRLFQHFLLNI